MKQTLWYPYAQMRNISDNYEVKSAKGVRIELSDGRKLIDGVSSWWAVLHGYNHPSINKVLKKQVDKMAHVMLGGLTHKPAKLLAQKLAEITPGDLQHVFFSDSGSVGVEVALKLSIQYWVNKGMPKKNRFVSLQRSYHGDTFKAMEVGWDSDFQKGFQRVFRKRYFVAPPSSGLKTGLLDISREINELKALLQDKHHKISALILEPILQCVGGFNVYSPEYLKAARMLCDQFDVLLIFDEVATGFGRTGKYFAANHAGVTPDIMVLGKGLTAGYIGHAATIARPKVFEAFLGDSYEDAFMHGPTFMGNTMACSIALESIRIFENENYIEKVAKIEKRLRKGLSGLKSEKIKSIRILGAMACIELKNASDLKGFQEFAMDRGVWLRPFGSFLYTMPPMIITKKELKKITKTMRNWFEG